MGGIALGGQSCTEGGLKWIIVESPKPSISSNAIIILPYHRARSIRGDEPSTHTRIALHPYDTSLRACLAILITMLVMANRAMAEHCSMAGVVLGVTAGHRVELIHLQAIPLMESVMIWREDGSPIC